MTDPQPITETPSNTLASEAAGLRDYLDGQETPQVLEMRKRAMTTAFGKMLARIGHQKGRPIQ